MTTRSIAILFMLLMLLPAGRAAGDDEKSLNRQLDNQVRGLKRTAFKRIEKTLGLESPDEDKITIEFRDLPEKLLEDRHLNGSSLEDNGDGTYTAVIHREFARAGLLDLEGEATYQVARAVWRQVYPKRAQVAAWFLHGMALHASGLGDDRILQIIADNERRTTEISDGWERETSHNERDHADDILLFRFVEADGDKGAVPTWLKAVGEGAEPHKVIGDPYPGGFRGLERDYMERAKKVIDDLSLRGLKEFRELYDEYQASKSKERAKMTGRFLALIKKYKRPFWEGKARYYMGCCWLEADREEKAIAEFAKVLGPLARRSDLRFIDMAKYKMGKLFLERNRRERAVATFKEYIRDFKWGKYQAEARLSLAEFYLDQRKESKAKPYLEWIVANEPKSSHGKKAKKLLGTLQ